MAGVAVMIDTVTLYYIGGGVIQGVGYGVLYISSLQHLLKWFPDRQGKHRERVPSHPHARYTTASSRSTFVSMQALIMI